jgi:hypothetical protein
VGWLEAQRNALKGRSDVNLEEEMENLVHQVSGSFVCNFTAIYKFTLFIILPQQVKTQYLQNFKILRWMSLDRKLNPIRLAE